MVLSNQSGLLALFSPCQVNLKIPIISGLQQAGIVCLRKMTLHKSAGFIESSIEIQQIDLPVTSGHGGQANSGVLKAGIWSISVSHLPAKLSDEETKLLDEYEYEFQLFQKTLDRDRGTSRFRKKKTSTRSSTSFSSSTKTSSRTSTQSMVRGGGGGGWGGKEEQFMWVH